MVQFRKIGGGRGSQPHGGVGSPRGPKRDLFPIWLAEEGRGDLGLQLGAEREEESPVGLWVEE
eukprot:9926571-Alexandrium_andersonii.AAC.1